MKRNHYRRGELHKLLKDATKEERWKLLIAVALEIGRLKKLKEMEDAERDARVEREKADDSERRSRRE